jgi:hypothetical protein
MISCCPGLDCLIFAVQPDTALSALAQLSALTYLYVTHVDSSAVIESLQPLSCLASLKTMQLDLCGAITLQSLLALTAFTALTSLHVQKGAGPDFDGANDIDIYFVQVWLVSTLCMACQYCCAVESLPCNGRA